MGIFAPQLRVFDILDVVADIPANTKLALTFTFSSYSVRLMEFVYVQILQQKLDIDNATWEDLSLFVQNRHWPLDEEREKTYIVTTTDKFDPPEFAFFLSEPGKAIAKIERVN